MWDGYMHKSKITVLSGMLLLSAALVNGQTIPGQQSRLTVKIVPDFATLDGEGPLMMTIHLKNGSRKFDTNRLPIVILEKVGDDRTQPVTVEDASQAYVRLDPKSSYWKNDHLRAGETAIIPVDLHALEWNDSKSSIRGNSKLSGILSPGRYRLTVLMIETVRENRKKINVTSTSNQLYVTYK